MKASISWATAVRIVFGCLAVAAISLAAVEISALFYLYSFNRDPVRWTNVSEFYARSANLADGETVPLATLNVRGNDGVLTYVRRYELQLDDFKPSALYDCLLAAEDRRFHAHTGLDYLRAAKAAFDVARGKNLTGASTISNQLIRTVILADHSRSGVKGILRKAAEIVLTQVAERHFSKDDILLAYVNNVPVGHFGGHALIGLSAASEAIFGKRDPKALSLSQACALGGLLNRPNGYFREAIKGDYNGIIKRRNAVLENLSRSNPGRYPKEAVERAKMEKIRFFRNSKKPPPEPRQFISYARQQLPSKKPGLRVYLTVDPALQRAAEAAVNDELARFDRGPYGFYNQLSHRHAITQGRKVTAEESKLQAALVALDAKTGEILAMVGGRNSASEFNRATQAKRAPGSLIKPFVYLYGIESGSYAGRRFRPDTIIDPSKSPLAQRYTTGGAARATVQLARSDNGAAVAIAEKFGISRVRDFVARATSTNPEASEGLAIGAGKGIEISPLELAAAYTIFPNNGVKVTSTAISAVDDGDKKLELPRQKPVRIVDAGAAVTVTRMLQSVIGDGPEGHYGTARMARQISGLEVTIPLAGKTGTGDNDLWFVGFTQRIIVVVWVGFDNNYPRFEMEKGFTGSGLPLQIWGRFMKEVKKYSTTAF